WGGQQRATGREGARRGSRRGQSGGSALWYPIPLGPRLGGAFWRRVLGARLVHPSGRPSGVLLERSSSARLKGELCGVEHRAQAQERCARHLERDLLAARRSQKRLLCAADDLAPVAVGDDEAGVGGKHRSGKARAHGEVELITIVAILPPLVIGTKVLK